MSTFEFNYASLAGVYERESERCVPGYRDELLPIVIAALHMPDNATVLDLPCGPGTFSEAILQKYEPKRLHCVDGTDAMLELCKDRLQEFGSRVVFQLADVFSYQPPEDLDRVFCGMFLHLFDCEKKKKILEMIVHHMKSGSQLVLTDVIRHADSAMQREQLRIRTEFALVRGADQNLLDAAYAMEQLQSVTVEELGALLHEVGLTSIRLLWMRTTFAAISAAKPSFS